MYFHGAPRLELRLNLPLRSLDRASKCAHARGAAARRLLALANALNRFPNFGGRTRLEA
jgi:hypothetical protein